MTNKKRIISVVVVFFIFLLFSGCATTSSGDKVDFSKGGVISFVAADRRPDSLSFAKAFIKKYGEKEEFTVVPESKIEGAFSNYPLNVFSNSIISSSKLTDSDRAAMKKVGKRLGGDFVCFVSLSIAIEMGGVVVYDVKNDSVISSFIFKYKFYPRGTLAKLHFSLFVKDYDKYFEKKMNKCIDFLDRKQLSSL